MRRASSLAQTWLFIGHEEVNARVAFSTDAPPETALDYANVRSLPPWGDAYAGRNAVCCVRDEILIARKCVPRIEVRFPP